MMDSISVFPAEPATLAPGTMVGEYRVETTLGHGGMATVYGAVHPLIGKRAAIKVMAPGLSADAAAVGRFVQEACAVNEIGHPNLVDVFSFGRLPDGRSYFVMEWLQGETLHDRLWKSHGPLPLPEVLNILDQICEGLEAAHDKGIIHRDLKPANVFLTPVRGRADVVRLLDFGVAKLVHRDSSPHWTSAGCVVGTPEYISPEQARGRDVDGRTDLYALGVIAYEMVLGRLPFISDNPADAIQMNLCATPPRPSILWPKIPAPLEALLLRLLAKSADERATLADVRRTVAMLRPSATPALDRVDAAPPPPQPLRRRRHLVRRGVLAATFLTLGWFGYRPAQPGAHKGSARPAALQPAAVTAALQPPAAAALQPAGVAAALQPPAGSATVAVEAAGSVPTPALTAPKAPPVRSHRHRRDANYLLDPFAR